MTEQFSELYLAWLDQVAKRDMFYIYMAAIVLTAFIWYKGWLGKAFKLVILLAVLGVCIGLVWGVWNIK